MNNAELPMNQEPHPPVVARVRVMGKDWQLLYMSLPVGTHDLYARNFSYRAPAQEEGSITFTREEIQKHEKYCEDLLFQIRGLEMEIKRLKAIKLPPPTIDCVVAFTTWYGFAVCEDMDIQTQIAWENWQIAWNAAKDN